MKIFTQDNELKERLEAANAENAELSELVTQREAEIKDVTEKMAEVSEGLEKRTAELEESNAACALLETEKEAIAAELAESKEAQADFDEKVNAAALAKMQELGVSEPVEAVEDENDVEMSRSAFNKLSPSDKSKFAISGGRIK